MKNEISTILGYVFLFLFIYFIFILGNDTFSFSEGVEGVNTELSAGNKKALMGVMFLIIIIFIVVMVIFGNNLLFFNLRHAEPFMNSISCSKKLDDEKMFCSTEHKKTLFTNLVTLDKKIDYLKKEFEKMKKKNK